MMRLIRDPEIGTYLQIGKRLKVYGYNEWKQLFQIRKCWWYDLTFYESKFEIGTMDKSCEYRWGCLGFGLTLRFDWDFAHSFVKAIADETYQEIIKGDTERPEGIE